MADPNDLINKFGIPLSAIDDDYYFYAEKTAVVAEGRLSRSVIFGQNLTPSSIVEFLGVSSSIYTNDSTDVLIEPKSTYSVIINLPTSSNNFSVVDAGGGVVLQVLGDSGISRLKMYGNTVSAANAAALAALTGINTGNQTITLTGDVTGSGTGSFAATLATVNSNVGSFGSSTAISTITVNDKGLITAVSTNDVVAPAGTLTGTTLNSTVVTSSLTSVGVINSGTWNGTLIGGQFGGTGVNNTGLTINLSSGAVGKIMTSDASGNASWTTHSSIGVTSITGTNFQVLANGTAGVAQTGAVTLTLPQSISTASSPTFAGLTLSIGGFGEPILNMTATSDCSARIGGGVAAGTGGQAYLEFQNGLTTSTNAWQWGLNAANRMDLVYGLAGGMSGTVVPISVVTSGYVGINQSVPLYQLHIKDNRADFAAYIDNQGVSFTRNGMLIRCGNNSGGGVGLRLISADSSGNIDFVQDSASLFLRSSGATKFVSSATGLATLQADGTTSGALNLRDNGTTTARQLFQTLSDGGVWTLRLMSDDATSVVLDNIITASYLGNVGMLGNLSVTRSANGSSVTQTISNTSNTAGSQSNLQLVVAGSTAGDPYIQFGITGAITNSFGVDNSDSDKVKLSLNNTLGANDGIVVTQSGEVTFPLTPAFLAYASAAQNNVTGNGTVYTVQFATEIFDNNGDFASDTFTAPVTGRYQLNAQVSFADVTSGITSGYLLINTSNRGYYHWINPYAISTVLNATLSLSVLADMDAGDIATVSIAFSGGSSVVDILITAVSTSFSGNLEN